MQVEFDLHEWVPDNAFQWKTLEEVLISVQDLDENEGEWPEGLPRRWEPLSAIRNRVEAVLSRYTAHETVLVMCHGVVIRALTGRKEVENCEIAPYQLPSE
jgi:broad specificity phosphatase PhoE